MNENYSTDRLVLDRLNQNDNAFLLELVNTPGWLQFIGNRNINTLAESSQYIIKILSSSDIQYWVVKIKGSYMPIGIITLIKRDYLPHHDIGFAFLPQYAKNGYAYEAATSVLNDAIKNHSHTNILATTIKSNTRSVHLLEKLGFQFDQEIENEQKFLQVYSIIS